MRRKDFPALDEPDISILCPRRSIPVISSSGSSGGLSLKVSRDTISGSSSETPSTKSSQSTQDFLPMFVAMRYCLLPFLVTPGIRERRDGLRFCLSMDTPFFSMKLQYEGDTLVYAALNGKELAI